MRAIFFGTPEIAVPVLAAMVEGGYAPLAVISQPARPAGRGHKLQDPPVAIWAREHDLPVHQPEKVNTKRFRAELAQLAPDVAVVVAFGQIFRRRLLALPRHGCVNLHASLLPRYRGAAPIQAAIAAGDAETGVTTMIMEEGLDSGPILLQETLPIGPEETAPELAARMGERGAKLVVRTLEGLERGDLTPRAQRPEQASYAPRLAKADGLVDWRKTAAEIHNRLRAYMPWPGQVATLSGERVKLLAVRPLGECAQGRPGTVLELRDDPAGGAVLPVVCGGGTALGLCRVQLPGKKPVSAADFANGRRLRAGERFAVEDML